MFLFSQMPTVIAPVDDDGFFAARVSIEGIQQPSKLRIVKTDGGQVGLDCILVEARFQIDS